MNPPRWTLLRYTTLLEVAQDEQHYFRYWKWKLGVEGEERQFEHRRHPLSPSQKRTLGDLLTHELIAPVELESRRLTLAKGLQLTEQGRAMLVRWSPEDTVEGTDDDPMPPPT